MLPTEPLISLPRWRHALALAWVLLLALCTAHLLQVWQDPRSRLDTDVLALLPVDSGQPLAQQALERLSAQVGDRVLLVLAGKERALLAALASRIAALLDADGSPLKRQSGTDTAAVEALVDFYAPWRDRLLDPALRTRLQSGSSALTLTQDILRSLLRPLQSWRPLPLADDPLQSFAGWLTARANATRLRPMDGWLGLRVDGQELLVMPYQLRDGALSIAALDQLAPLLAQMRTLAADTGVQLLLAGVPVHAAAAAQRAQWEMSVIGGGSALAIALLVWASLRSLRPVLLVLGSVAAGSLVGLSLCFLVFDSVHLLTLVFGASLVGVAEDYGIHYLAERALERQRRPDLARSLAPTLALAFVTTALGYLALAVAPFPGLKQMALFSITGLGAALVTVLLLFPLLEGRSLRATALSWRYAQSRRHWSRLQANRGTALAVLVLLALLGMGLSQLQTRDDLRALNQSPPQLLREQAQIAAWLDEPSPAQFFLVTGSDPQQLLEHEEALTARLRALAAAAQIGGYRALSDWLPSHRRQAADQVLLAAALPTVRSTLEATLGPLPLATRALSATPLQPDEWLASSASTPLRPLWLDAGAQGGAASMVMVAGLHDASQLQALTVLASELPGVRWVDRIADYSLLLRGYRIAMLQVLAGALLLMALTLTWRFRRDAWRVLLPVLLVGLLVVALLGLSGRPLELFHVLGLLVLLGMGVDYGIFLQSAPDDAAPWLAIGLGALSTVLAFGLLAFSASPALAAFGGTLLVGISLTWLTCPLFCKPEPSTESPA